LFSQDAGSRPLDAVTTRALHFGERVLHLLDGMAHAGRGEVEYVTLESQAEAAVEGFRSKGVEVVVV
jgi:hypothetical protein